MTKIAGETMGSAEMCNEMHIMMGTEIANAMEEAAMIEEMATVTDVMMIGDMMEEVDMIETGDMMTEEMGTIENVAGMRTIIKGGMIDVPAVVMGGDIMIDMMHVEKKKSRRFHWLTWLRVSLGSIANHWIVGCRMMWERGGILPCCF